MNENVEVGHADSLAPGDIFRNRHGRWLDVTGVLIEEGEVKIRAIDRQTRKEMFCFYRPDKAIKIIRRGEAPPSI